MYDVLTRAYSLYNLNLRSTNSSHQISVMSPFHTRAQSSTSHRVSMRHAYNTFQPEHVSRKTSPPLTALIVNTSQVSVPLFNITLKKKKSESIEVVRVMATLTTP